MDLEFIETTIKKLPNNAVIGPDGISINLLKNGGQNIVHMIADIGRSSLDESRLPSILKIGWVSPIWKGNEKDSPVDYRPISLTSHIGKVLEKITKKYYT